MVLSEISLNLIYTENTLNRLPLSIIIEDLISANMTLDSGLLSMKNYRRHKRLDCFRCTTPVHQGGLFLATPWSK